MCRDGFWKAVLLVFAGIAVAGCRSDDETDNQACESDCVARYAADLVGCGNAASECMAGCATPDDIDCMWDCEEHEDECAFDFIMCVAGCPCLERAQSCISKCGNDDQACLTGCADEYLDCGGTDSPYTCSTNCDAQKASCVWDCEDGAADMDAFLSCRDACADAQIQCLGECA